MERVIVTVKRQDEARVRDLEVPAEVDAGQLANLVAHALRWDSDAAGQPIEYEIAAEPPGRVLRSDESLMDAGVWDGAWLVFQPVGDRSFNSPGEEPPPISPPPVDAGGPVDEWRSLGVDLPVASEQQEETDAKESPDTGFVWKQVD